MMLWLRALSRENYMIKRVSDRMLAVVLVSGLALGGCAAVTKSREDASPDPASMDSVSGQKVIKIEGVEISAETEGTRLRLLSSGLPNYDLNILADPPSVQLDLQNVDVVSLPSDFDVEDGTLNSVQISSTAAGGARITLDLSGPGDATVVPMDLGLDLVVRLRGQTAAVGQDSSIGSSSRLTNLMQDGTAVAFNFGSEPEEISAFVLSDEKRLVVDANGVSISTPTVTEEFEKGPLLRVRFGQKDNGVRGVVEAREAGVFEGYRIEKKPDGFVLAFNRLGSAELEPFSMKAEPKLASAPELESKIEPKLKPKSEPVSGSAEATLPAKQAPAKMAPPLAIEKQRYPAAGSRGGDDFAGGGKVVDLGFKQTANRSMIEVALSSAAPHVVSEATAERVVLDLENTELTQRFQRALDTSAFRGAVKLVAAYQQGNRTRVVVDLKNPTPFSVERDPTHVVLAFEGGSEDLGPMGVAEIHRQGEEIVLIEGGGHKAPISPSSVEDGLSASATSSVLAGEANAYAGRRISMDFVDADLKNILRLLGDVSELNIVAGDDVSGTITVRLVDVPWDQALDVILKTRGLDKVRDGNVVRIAKAEKLAAERQRFDEAIEAQRVKEPLVTDIISVNYATADEVSDKVTSILSERGVVTVDERTNAILIKDVALKVAEAKALVARLDTQTPQVLIEARIVEVSSTFKKELGVQWGGRFTADTAHGNASDWAFPHSVGAGGATGTSNYAVNLPGGGGTSAAMALSLGHINDIFNLDLRLSALETSGEGRVVSSPRVTTLDNRVAEIRQGVEIPFTTATQDKIETKSISYLLKLNVTPHVTADASIMMKIDLTKDAPSTSYFANDGTPGIETRAANTEVLVKDGETTVIGGIITDTQSDINFAVPWFSKIPFIGWMFRKKDNIMDKTELVIFITPRIVTPSALSTRSL